MTTAHKIFAAIAVLGLVLGGVNTVLLTRVNKSPGEQRAGGSSFVENYPVRFTNGIVIGDKLYKPVSMDIGSSSPSATYQNTSTRRVKARFEFSMVGNLDETSIQGKASSTMFLVMATSTSASPELYRLPAFSIIGRVEIATNTPNGTFYSSLYGTATTSNSFGQTVSSVPGFATSSSVKLDNYRRLGANGLLGAFGLGQFYVEPSEYLHVWLVDQCVAMSSGAVCDPNADRAGVTNYQPLDNASSSSRGFNIDGTLYTEQQI